MTNERVPPESIHFKLRFFYLKEGGGIILAHHRDWASSYANPQPQPDVLDLCGYTKIGSKEYLVIEPKSLEANILSAETEHEIRQYLWNRLCKLNKKTIEHPDYGIQPEGNIFPVSAAVFLELFTAYTLAEPLNGNYSLHVGLDAYAQELFAASSSLAMCHKDTVFMAKDEDAIQAHVSAMMDKDCVFPANIKDIDNYPAVPVMLSLVEFCPLKNYESAFSSSESGGGCANYELLVGTAKEEDRLFSIRAALSLWKHPLINLSRSAADFYLFEYLTIMNPRDTKVAQAFSDHINFLADTFSSYMLMIVGGELRHVLRHNSLSSLSDDLRSVFPDDAGHFRLRARSVSWVKWYEVCKRVGATKAAELAMTAFQNCRWGSSSYGGKTWWAIAYVLHQYLTGELSKKLFVDACWSLQHNGGSCFSKIAFEGCTTLTGLLNAHASGDVMSLLPYAEKTQPFCRLVKKSHRPSDHVAHADSEDNDDPDPGGNIFEEVDGPDHEDDPDYDDNASDTVTATGG